MLKFSIISLLILVTINSATASASQFEKDSPLCEACTDTLTEAQILLSQNKTDEFVLEFLESQLCDPLGPLANACKMIIKMEGPTIIKELASKIEPKVICYRLKLCTSKVLFENSIDTGKHSEEVLCTVCQFVQKYIISDFKIDQTEQVIEFSINNVCKLTPNKYKHYCESIVNNHGPKFISLMTKYTDPEIICQSLRMCLTDEEEVKKIEFIQMAELTKAAPVHRYPILQQSIPNEGNNTLQCSLCLYVAQIADLMLKQNKTEKQIVNELELICNLFPSKLTDECISFIGEYGPYVVELIAKDLEPEVVCATLNLCQNKIDTIEHKSLRSLLSKS